MDSQLEAPKVQSIKKFILTQADDFFVEGIPVESIKNLPSSHLYAIGSVAHAITLSILIYFVYQSYQAATTQPYISVTDDGNCNTVPIAQTGSFFADREGNWAGTPEYVVSSSAYQLNLNNFEVSSEDDYVAMMNVFETALNTRGVESENLTLAENLLFWTSWVEYYSVANPSATDFSKIGYGRK
jgi:hypothetical protein